MNHRKIAAGAALGALLVPLTALAGALPTAPAPFRSEARPARRAAPPGVVRAFARILRFETSRALMETPGTRGSQDAAVGEALRTLVEAGYTRRLLEMARAAHRAARAEAGPRAPQGTGEDMARVSRVADDCMKRKYPGVPQERRRTYRKSGEPSHHWFVDYWIDVSPRRRRTVTVDARSWECVSIR